jgi:diguanylate cyclase (GGDEF)-like protein
MWKTPRSPLAFILSVEALCVTWLVLANASGPPALADIGRFFLLFAVAAVYAEGGDRVERLRRFVGYVENSTIVTASSLWCCAAALILPVGAAGVFVVCLHAHTLIRANRTRSNQPYRVIYVGATEVLAAMAASAVIGHFVADRAQLGSSLASLAATLFALLVYAAVNEALVVAVLALVTRTTSPRALLGSVDDHVMEAATLALGVLLAVALLFAPFVAPLTLLPILVLRRSALVRELQVQATHDAKTGLLNAGGWRQEADRELVRAERQHGSMSVLMVDLDHFKRLNDSFGHPAGDATLKAVADCLTVALRGYDAIGRFGGEEFIALLADADESVSTAVAERLCERIRKLELAHGGRVTASIGVGLGLASIHGLDELIAVADKALYVAKGSGRDQVQVARAAVRSASPTSG